MVDEPRNGDRDRLEPDRGERLERDRIERFERYLDALLGDGRPSPDDVADPDEAEMARLAAELAAAVPSGIQDPDPAFVEQLRLRMRAADQGIAAVKAPPPVRRDVRPQGARLVRLTRRQLLGVGLGTAAGLAAGAAGGFVLSRALEAPAPGWPDVPLVGDAGEWARVASADELPAGAVLPFSTAAFGGFLVNDAGEIRALGSACTHLGCTLSYRPEFNDLRCPCHPASFNLAGWLANSRRHWREEGPYPGDAEPYPIDLPPLPRPRVKVEDGAIYVWTARA
jgi:nitrite reductase/ring-hydroxylating ferredoxin subunit